jgi:hypothetical protein
MDEEVKLGICPFCGEEIITNEFNLIWLECLGKWYFSHYCCDDAEGHHTVAIAVTGRTREEVIKRCRASLNRKDV